METGSAAARSRGEGPNPVEFKSRFHQKNYLRITDPLHSPSLLPLKEEKHFFLISHKSFSPQKDFCAKYCNTFGFKQLNTQKKHIYHRLSSLCLGVRRIFFPKEITFRPFMKHNLSIQARAFTVPHLISLNHHQLQ